MGRRESDSDKGGVPFSVARAELLALYAETDRLLSGFTCPASTECCRFGTSGREPYPTSVELAELERAMRAANIQVGAGARRRGTLPIAREALVCPMLGEDGRCRVYAARPFGCRTFFCERASGPGKLPRAEIQRISRDIADLSARYDPADPGARPLTRALSKRPGLGH